MAVRIRESGAVVCAAMHPAEPGDVYVHDGVHYELSAVAHLLVTDVDHAQHGLWWWRDAVPTGVLVDRWWERRAA